MKMAGVAEPDGSEPVTLTFKRQPVEFRFNI
jgi:hypothetical protein